MKKNLLLLICFSVCMFSCSKNDQVTESSTSGNTSTTTISETEVIINVIDVNNNAKSGYSVIMFLEQPSMTEVLPEIQMEVISNSDGIVNFNLNEYIDSPTTIYLEAFIKDGDNYIWKSITHPQQTIDIGTKWTTSIIVE